MTFLQANSPVYFALIPVGIIALVALFVVFVRIKIRQTRALLGEYLEANHIQATVIGGWMPPLRLWIHNRKHDSWGQIREEDRTVRWVRIRYTLLSGRQFEFFD